MAKLLWLVVLGLCAWRLIAGRWPWQAKTIAPGGTFEVARARVLLGVSEGAGRKEILEGHRRLMISAHPDRGGSNEKVHEANAARDLLLAALPADVQGGA